MKDITRILSQIDQGNRSDAEKLLPLVYDELRKLATAKLVNEKPGQTLQATALVHEAYIRIVDKDAGEWNSRGHFFGAAANAMRRIIVENARRKQRIRHGGEWKRSDQDPVDIACALPDADVLALDEALERLQKDDPFKAQLIQLRFFAGLTNEQAADSLNVSPATAKRHWRFARAWLYREIRGGDEDSVE